MFPAFPCATAPPTAKKFDITEWPAYKTRVFSMFNDAQEQLIDSQI